MKPKWSERSLLVRPRRIAESSHFKPKTGFSLDSSFPYSELWDNLLSRPIEEIENSMLEIVGDKVWNQDECFEFPMIKQGPSRASVARIAMSLPACGDQPEISGRVSPRTMFFFAEFGYLRQVKPMCGNPACVNPYHQMTENIMERDPEFKVQPNMGRTINIPVFDHDLTLAGAFELMHEAGFVGVDFTKVTLLAFINTVVAQSEYKAKIGRPPVKYETTIDVKCEIVSGAV